MYIFVVLLDAGMYEEGMGLEEKRRMMQLLEESRASAQQEAEEREQWRQQEEQIFNETLNKSFKENPEVLDCYRYVYVYFMFIFHINENVILPVFICTACIKVNNFSTGESAKCYWLQHT